MVILCLTCLLGLPGNGMVLWVAGLKMKRTVNTVWFLHLTLADFLCCLSLPFSLANLILRGYWPYGLVLCKLIPSIILLNMFASVFLLTAISLDRCLMVHKPIWCQNHRNVRTAFTVCGCVWAVAFVMCVPVFVYRDLLTIDNHSMCVYNFDSHNHKPTPLVAISVTRLVVGFLVPLFIMVACYSLIVFRMRKSNFTKSRSKTFRVALVVVTIFFVCWTPYHIVGVLLLIADPETPLMEAALSWDHIAIALASANSCFNPFLYALLGKDFRKKAKQSIKGVLEAAFSEELTHSTSCTQDRASSKRNNLSTDV
ncbi:C3a anaphylatoxin chemotactic receptor [Lemmus lemmus]